MSQATQHKQSTHTLIRLESLAAVKQKKPLSSQESQATSSSSCGFQVDALTQATSSHLTTQPRAFALVPKVQITSYTEQEFKLLKEEVIQRTKGQITLLEKECDSFFVFEKTIKKGKIWSLQVLTKQLDKCTTCGNLEKVFFDALDNPLLTSGRKSRVKKLLIDCLGQVKKFDTLSHQPTSIITSVVASFLAPRNAHALCQVSKRFNELTLHVKNTTSQVYWFNKCLALGIKKEAFSLLQGDNLTNFKLLYSKIWMLSGNVQGALSAEVLCLLTGREDLIEKHCEALVNLKLPLGVNANHIAALSGSKSLLKYALAKGQLSLESKDNFGANLILYAALSGSVKLVKYVLNDLQFSKESKSNSGANLLLFAAWSGSVELVKYVLDELKFSKESKSNFGANLLLYAAMSGSVELVKYVLNELKFSKESKSNFGANLLLYAAPSGSVELVKYVLDELKISIGSKDNFGANLLHFAAKNNAIEVLKYLIQVRGMRADYADNRGVTPLAIAHAQKHQAAVEFLEGEMARLRVQN